jgi:hypothetical protein
MEISKSKWFLPSFSMALGLIMLGAQWLGGGLTRGRATRRGTS